MEPPHSPWGLPPPATSLSASCFSASIRPSDTPPPPASPVFETRKTKSSVHPSAAWIGSAQPSSISFCRPPPPLMYPAAILMGDKKHDIFLHLIDVVPLSHGIEGKGGLMSVVIPRNTSIPTMKEKTFVTTEDNQSRVPFNVYEGERAMVKDNSLRDKFTLSGITLAPKGVTKMQVRFEIDQDGMLHVSAEEKESGQKNKITITNDVGRFSMEEIKRMLQEAQEYKAVDEELKKKAQARNDFEDFIYSMRNKDIKKLQDAADGALKWLKNNELNTREINAKKKQLEGVCASIIRQSSRP